MQNAAALPYEISVAETKELLQQPGAILLVDCREADEYAIAKIDGAVLIPMSEMGQR